MPQRSMQDRHQSPLSNAPGYQGNDPISLIRKNRIQISFHAVTPPHKATLLETQNVSQKEPEYVDITTPRLL